MDMTEMNHLRPAQKIAVVGGGISGLAAAWLLRDTHRVTLYEAADYVGGHTHTIDVTLEGHTAPVDTGFLVFNRKTYPNLCELFAHLGVEAVASEMSFSVSLTQPDLEWSGTSLQSLFGQSRNLVRPAFWRMLLELNRFNREAAAIAADTTVDHGSLGDYLDSGGYSQSFRDWYLLPMAAAIWSCPTGTMLAYPVSTFARFCLNHGLLQINDRPQWLTVRGGGRSYVEKMVRGLPDVRINAAVRHIERDAQSVRIHTDAGCETYDQVILACHSDQALNLLGGQATQAENTMLSALRYQPNTAYLHTDPQLLPRRQSVWSAWNYSAGKQHAGRMPVSVSYLINRLQPLPFRQPVVVSLNPYAPPRDEHIIERIEYAHPIFDQLGVEAQRWLPGLQGRQRTWFAGAWQGYGFHEDGLRSAMQVAAGLGATIPWAREATRPLELV